MKNCTHCKYANWRRTESGRLHPSGSGRCTFPWRMPVLPQAFYWLGSATPCGGHIERKRDLKDHCAYYALSPPTIPTATGGADLAGKRGGGIS